MAVIPSGIGLQKALLRVVEGESFPKSLTFSFNPSEYTVTKGAVWRRPETPSASSTTTPEFTHASPTTVQMEIFFDAFEERAGDVSGNVLTLLNWTIPTRRSGDNGRPQPPLISFVWGSNLALVGFKGFLRNVTARYTMFRLDGTPVRATATITLEEVPPEDLGTNPTSGAIEGRRSHVVTEGDSLHSIAYREYGRPDFWRGLAEFNGIDDPFRLATGTAILIPTAAEAARLS